MQVTEEYTAKLIACRLEGHIIAKRWAYKQLKNGDKSYYPYCFTCHQRYIRTGDTGPG